MKNANKQSASAAEMRRQAEEQLKRQQPAGAAPLAKADAARLLHELQVHQIELEMQNAELHRAEAEREASRTRYFDLYDLAPVGYCTVSEEGLILEANLTLATQLGVDRDALVTRLFSRYILKEDQDIFYGLRQQLLDTGQRQTWELRMTRPDGLSFWAHLAATVVPADAGRPVLRVVVSDVTERKQAEAALRLSEEKFAKAFRSSPDGFILSSVPEGRITEVNDTVTRISGYTPEELLGRTTVELGLWVDPEVRERYADTVRREGRVTNFEGVFRAKSGTLHTCLISTEIIPLQTGPHFLSVLRDITAQKQAEAAQRESEVRFRDLFERIPDGVMVVDAATRRFVLCNGQLCRMLGYTLEEFSQLGVADIHPAADLPQMAAEFAKLAENKTNLAAGFPVRRKDGSVFKADILSSQVQMAGRPCVLGMFRDITEREQAEEKSRRWQQVFEKAGFALAHTDVATNAFLEMNAFCAQERGYRPEELVGQPITQIYPPEVLPAMRERLQNIDRVGHLAFESVHLRKDGSTFPVLVDVTTIRDAKGRPVSRVAYSLDITERKRAEAELQQQHEEIVRFNEAMVGREMRFIELKEEINALCRRLGEPPRYGPDAAGAASTSPAPLS